MIAFETFPKLLLESSWKPRGIARGKQLLEWHVEFSWNLLLEFALGIALGITRGIARGIQESLVEFKGFS